MIPVLYNKDEKQFRSYGLGELSDFVETPDVKRERNGQYTFYMRYQLDGVLANELKEGMKIKSSAGPRTEWQTFEINRIVADSQQFIEVYANHVSMRTQKDAIRPRVNGRNFNGQQLLELWRNNLVGDDHWEVWSDITTQVSVEWKIEDYNNAREVLGGKEGSILDRIGGEYEFDNQTIRLWRQMGRTAPIVLEYGRNIKSVVKENQEDSVYTSVYPFAMYTPEGRETMEIVTLPEFYVDSNYVGMYDHRKVQVVDFTSEFDNDNPPTVQAVRQLAQQFIEANEVGSPWQNVKVEYQDLSKTLDYKDFQVMEEVELNDVVPIFYPKLDVMNNNAKVVVTVWDPVKEEYKNIELGVIGQRIGNVLNRGINERLNQIEREQERQHVYIVNAAGNRIWYSTPPDDVEHKIGDLWFEENGPYTRLRIWNGNQWMTELDTEDIDQIAQAIEAQQEDIKDAKSSADAANQQINDAIQNAGFTSLTDTISYVDNLANTAEANAQTAMTLATDLSGQVSDFELTVDGFNATIQRVEADYGELEGTVSSLGADVSAVAEQITNRVWQTDIDDTMELITHVETEWRQTAQGFEQSITQIESDVNGKASLVAFNTLESKVDGTIQRIGDAEGNITQIEANVNGLQTTVASKASQTEVTQLATGFNVLSTNFNNLEIGGRNYASTEKIASIYRASGSGGTLNPNHSECPYGFYSVNVQAETTVFRIDNIITGNGLWTVSFDIRGSQNAAVSQRVSIADSPEQTLRTNTTNTWRRVSATFNVTDYTEEKAYLDFRPTWAHLFVRNLVVEKGNKATDWTPAPEDMASQAQLSVLNDQINLRVEKGELMSQINIEAGRTLIDTDRLYLSANTTVFGGSAFIPNAAIESLSADKLTAGTINAAEINVIGLNTSDIVGLNSEFIRSQWNSGAGGNVQITGSGIVTTASNGSQSVVQNGVFLTRSTTGATLGYLGFDQDGSNPMYTLTTTFGSNFRIRGTTSTGSFTRLFEILPGSDETYVRTASAYTRNLTVEGHHRVTGQLNLSSVSIVGSAINFTGPGGYIDVQSNSNMRVNAAYNLVLRARGKNVFLADDTRNYMYQPLNMQDNAILQVSDERMKTNIVYDEVNSLACIKSWKFAGFNWRYSNNTDRQFSVIAQSAIDLTEKDHEGILTVDISKQLNITSHAVQQLDKKVVNIKDYLDKQFEQIAFDNLQRDLEIKRLKERVAQLEKGAS